MPCNTSSTLKQYKSDLSKAMGIAISWDYVSNNPVRGVKMPERTLKRLDKFR